MLLRNRLILDASPQARVPAVSGVAGRRAHVLDIALELGLILALALLALALRLPHYDNIPGFSDETEDIYRGLLILQGRLFPLVDTVSSYNGALWHWLLAGALWVGGKTLAAPRALVLGFGVLTVLATYLLGRAWGGRAGGLLAAGLLATAPEHIVVNSHVAWGNCITPLFTTLGTLALWHALRGAGASPRRGLILAGLWWGLALQTHPSVVALLAAAGVYVLARRRDLLRSPWLYAGASFFLLINLPTIVYNLLTGFGSVAEGLDKSARYTNGVTLTPLVYLQRVGLLLQALAQNLSGTIDIRKEPFSYLLDPGLWPISLLAVAAVVWQWRRGNHLPAVLLVGMVLLLPLFNDKYRPVLNGRYLAPLSPILYASIGALFTAGVSWLRQRFAARPRPQLWVAEGALGLAAVFILLHPLVYLDAFYQQAIALGRTNTQFFRAIERIKANYRPGERVLLDSGLNQVPIGWGAGWALRGFRLALELADIPSEVVNVSSPGFVQQQGACRSRLLVLASRDPVTNARLAADLRLHPIGQRPMIRRMPVPRAGGYGIFRLPASAGCRAASTGGVLTEGDALNGLGDRPADL